MNLFDESLLEPKDNSKKINKIIIQNYRNIPYKEYVLNGNSILLYGANGLGKTNVIEAVYWALSGVLFNGVSLSDKQEIKPYDSQKDTITSVRLEFNNFIFERRFRETWSKDGETKTGTETTLLVNGAASKDQNSATVMLLDYLGLSNMQNTFAKNPTLSKTSLFELVYNAKSLKDIDYKIIRAIITDMVGETDFKKIINENPTKYAKLVEPLKSHGMDMQALKTDTHSKIADKKNGLEKQVSDLEANIKSYDESAKKTADPEELAKANGEIDEIDKEISKLERQKTASNSTVIREYDGEISQKQNKIYERQNEIRTAHEIEIKKLTDTSLEKDLSEKNKSVLKIKKDRFDLNEEISKKERNKETTEFSIKSKESELESLKKKRDNLRDEWKRLKNPGNYTCPKCNQVFSLGDTKEYQESIAKKLEEINITGKETVKSINGLEEGIGTLKIEVEAINSVILEKQKGRDQFDKNLTALQGEITELETKIEKQNASLPVLDLNNDTAILKLKDEIKEIENKKKTISEDLGKHLEDINAKISELKAKKQPLTDITNLESTARSYQQSAANFRKELQVVNVKLQAEKDIETLLKDLEKEMYEKLDERVQGVFGDNFSFKLWKLNTTNGEYDTRICEIYTKDIHGNLVNIKNINTGLFPARATELISKIKVHYGVPKSFIFVDELGTLDEKHRQTVKSFGEQIFATQMAENTAISENLF